MEARCKFFSYLMGIMDNAEGERSPEVGSFSFLWENSYVRNVVSSPSFKTSIAGLKNFLAIDMLEMYSTLNPSKVSYKDIQAVLEGTASKKYCLNYNILDDCLDCQKNREAMLTKSHGLSVDGDLLKKIENSDIWIPFLFMDKLRTTVWNKLSVFFKLCDQKSCSECTKKTEVYFQFIQAVAVYEIFYIELVQEKAAEYMEELMLVAKETMAELCKLEEQGELLKNCDKKMVEEALPLIQDVTAELGNIWSNSPEEKIVNAGIYQLLVIEFGISLNAMFYLLMVLEAMHVWDGKMRGIKNLSSQIQERLDEIYEKDLSILQNYNKKRAKRYREVNVKLEELLEKYTWPECKDDDEAIVINTFIEELCKPLKLQNKNVLRGFEVMLGYPIYKDLGESRK